MTATDNATTRTRADDVRRYVQLDALSDVLCCLAEYLGGGEPEDSMLGSMPWDTLMVDDGSTDGDLGELGVRLWPDGIDEREGTLDWNLVQAESHALAARMFALLTTDGARAALARYASQVAADVEGDVRHMRKLIELEGAEA
jgi:hypothetical protein